MNFLSKLEEKYVFKTSLIFWHILVGIAAIGVIVGAVLFLYALLPASKPSVEKRSYPPEVSVSADDLTALLPQPSIQKVEKKPTQVEEVKEPVEETATEAEPEQVDPAKQAFEASLEKLKMLIPPDRYSWKSKGHWEYPYGKSAWQNYKKPKYRNWVVDRWGVDDILERGFKKANIGGLSDATRLLDAHVSLLSRFDEDQRVAALRAITEYLKGSVDQSVRNVNLLGESVENFSSSRVDFIMELSSFGRKNPRDGYEFIEFANSSLGKFNPEVRMDALKMLVLTYYRHFNNRISYQKEITPPLLSVIGHIPPKNQVATLENYYKLYLDRSQDRSNAIKRIDRQYQRDLSEAESVYSMNRAKKAGLKLLSGQVIGGCIVAIAVLALILALLSIQRGIKRMNDKIGGTL